MATRMQQRRGTAAQWISTNSGNGPILAAGEIGFESDTNKFKIGDGVNHWKDLGYFTDAASLIDGAPNLLNTLNELAAAIGDDPTFITTVGTNLSNHQSDTTNIHGIADTSLLATQEYVDDAVGNATVNQSTLAGEGILWNLVSEKFDLDLFAGNNLDKAVAQDGSVTVHLSDDPVIGGTVTADAIETPSLTVTNLAEVSDLSISGTLTFNGTATEINSTSLNVTDPMIYMGDGNTSNTLDLGIVAAFDNGTYQHSGLVRDASDGKWKLFSGVTTEPTTTIDFATYTRDPLEIGVLHATGALIGDVTEIELQYVHGVTSAIQTQINAKPNFYAPIASPTFTGTVSGVTKAMVGLGNVDNTSDANKPVSIATQTELNNKLDTSTAASTYAPISSPVFTTAATLPSATSIGDVSATEIGYLNGVTSSIQAQLDAKTDSSHASTTTNVHGISDTAALVTLTGSQTLSNKTIEDPTITAGSATISATELGYLDGVTSAIQTQIDSKQAVVSGVSSTEIGYLDGVTSSIQTQIDSKAPLASPTLTGTTTTSDLVVNGDFTVNGTNFAASATTITIEDNLVQLAHQNAANTVDLGLVVAYNDGTAKHAGIVRDVSDSKWKLFKGVTTEPATTVDFTEGSLDDLAVNNLTAAGVVFTDGTQTKQGVPSITPIIQKTASYTLSSLTERDSLVEVASSSATTITIPTNSAVAYPIGTSIDILQTSTGQVTIAGDTGVTVNATPGLKLRTTWSSATLFKRAENTWVVYGDLTA